MPNRTLKESICNSDNLNQLSAEEERFFYRIIVNCDDFGRLDARPLILRSKGFPIKVDKAGNPLVKLDEVVQWVTALATNELISVYLHFGRPYLQVLTFENHNQRRAKNSKYPSIDEEGSVLIAIDDICKHLLANDSTFLQVRSDTYKRISYKRNRSTKADDSKIKFAEFVYMTQEEYQKLVDVYGEELAKRLIEKLDNAKGAKNYSYKSDYRAILNWVVESVTGKKPGEFKQGQNKAESSQLENLYRQAEEF